MTALQIALIFISCFCSFMLGRATKNERQWFRMGVQAGIRFERDFKNIPPQELYECGCDACITAARMK